MKLSKIANIVCSGLTSTKAAKTSTGRPRMSHPTCGSSNDF